MILKSIQVMRAIAALSVVLFHLGIYGFSNGAAGVDIFFVISGFIMGATSLKLPAAAFVSKRLVRIVPLYWIATLLMCAGSLVPGLFAKFQFDAASLLKSLFFIPYFDASGNVWPLLVPGWTLNYEMLFYLIFTVGLLVSRPVLVCHVVIVSLVIAGLVFSPQSAPLRFWTDPILLEFLAGLLIATRFGTLGARTGAVLLAAGALFFVVSTFYATAQMPRILMWGAPAVLVVSGAVALERARKWPDIKPLERIGDASYSLYLLHGFVINAVHKVLKLPVILDISACLILSIALAYLSWKFIELDISRKISLFVTQKVLKSNVGGVITKQ